MPQRAQPVFSELAKVAVENSAIPDLNSAGRLQCWFYVSRFPNKYRAFLHGFVWPCTCNVQHRSMDQISVLAAGGMRERMEALDVVANNLANSSTDGYKSDGEFYSVFASELAGDDGAGPTAVPTLDQKWTDFSAGLLETTNNPLDFGIAGKGFFEVQGPSGPLYTRNGNFHLDTNGQLVTSDGYALLQESGQPFQANSGKRLEVAPDGNIKQDGNSIGQIKLVQFANTAGLSKRGSNYFLNNTGQQPRRRRDRDSSRQDRSVECQRSSGSRTNCRLDAAIRNDEEGHLGFQRDGEAGH